MKVNELRIGNWVVGYDGKEFQWDLSHFNLLHRKIDADEIGKPIPLTEEWLLKFGFEEKNKLFRVSLDATSDFFIATNGDALIKEHSIGAVIPLFTAFRYVHQLQNLFHALTGEELAIKQPA